MASEPLKQHGMLTVRFDPSVQRDAAPSGRRGRQQADCGKEDQELIRGINSPDECDPGLPDPQDPARAAAPESCRVRGAPAGAVRARLGRSGLQHPVPAAERDGTVAPRKPVEPWTSPSQIAAPRGRFTCASPPGQRTTRASRWKAKGAERRWPRRGRESAQHGPRASMAARNERLAVAIVARTNGGAMPHRRPPGRRGPGPGGDPEPLHGPWNPGHRGRRISVPRERGTAVIS